MERAAQMASTAINVPCCILLNSLQMARVKGGDSGVNLRFESLQQRTGLVMHVLSGKDIPVGFANRDEHVVLVHVEKEMVLEAVSGIIRLAFQMDVACHEAEAESERSIEMLIPDASSSHVIGDKGARFGSIMDETRCNLHMMRQPMGVVVEHKRVRITGRKIHDMAFAISRLHDLLIELACSGMLQSRHFDIREGVLTQDMHGFQEHSNVTVCVVSLLMSKDEASWLTSNRSNDMDRLQISVRNADAPPFHPNEVIVEIIGTSLSEQIHTLELIIDDVMVRHGSSKISRFLIPLDHFGAVIGRGGEVIKRIIEETGANLHQQPAERHAGSLYPLRVLGVTGNRHERVSAARAIYEVVEKEQHRTSKMDGEAASGQTLKQQSQLGRKITPTEHIQRVQPVPAICTEPTVPPVRASDLVCVTSNTPDAQHNSTAATGFTSSAMMAASCAVPASVDKTAAPSLRNDLALFLLLPTIEIARFLASGDLGIARRTGAQLTAGSGGTGEPVLRVCGTPMANASACYLVQEALWLTGMYRAAAFQRNVDSMGIPPTF